MTTRTLTPAVDGAMAAGHVPLLVFVLMDFPSGMLRVNNSGVTIPWDGHDWLGVGRLGGIGAIEEGATLEARGLQLAISGVPPENIAIALGQSYQGRDCKVWAAPLTEGHAVLSDPALVFWGRMDTMDIDLGETATITVSAESRLADWNRPRVRRYNHEDQQIDFAGDLFFDQGPQMVEKELRWGY
jgi:hypothetical protein